MAIEESNAVTTSVLIEDIDMEEAHKEPSTVDRDDQILKLDFSERMQIYDDDDDEITLEGISIHDESQWIHNQLEPLFGSISRDDIFRFLQMHHVQKLDIPFIAMYRKEDCLSLLKDPEQPEEEKSTLKWHKVLWAIQKLHKKWLLFQNQKRALQFHYNKRFEEESRRGLIHDETPQLFESIMKSLRAAESKREVEDVNSKFNLHFPAGEGQAAIDISSDPGVRKYVRSNYFDFVEVSVTSTKPGLNMDCQKKPLNRFEDAQWLLVQKAEEENLVQVTIKLPEDRLNKLISDLSNYYLSKSAQLWNEQRKLILQDALSNFLLPSMEKEARSLLVSRAKNWLLMECGEALWNRVAMAPPYKRNQTAPPRVMACCWGPGDPATTLVMLDSCGELLDVLCIGTISWENLTWTVPFFDEPTRLRMENDDKRILKFVNDHEPDLAIIGATNMSCDMLKLQLLGIESLQVPEKMIPLRVVYGDETLACLYENSQISADQLPGQSGMVRRAVALGRYLQNPLAMVATLCGPGREILSWKPLTSPFDNFLTPDEKYAMIEQVMVDVTNQVSLDITLATSHEWLFAPLQFISGLGPRKAASLQQSLVRSGEILARRELATLHGLGRRVYLNAVGFLRIRQHGLAATSTSSQFNALLDDTRIHPESYLLAQEMAKDVYDDKDAMELQRIRDQPSYLEKLDVEAYAKSKKLENKMQTLCGIRRELIQGFQDERKRYEELDEDGMFYTMTGETCNTLSQGSIVQAIVRRALPKTTICTVGAGLICTLKREDFTVNGREISDLSQVLNVGDIITCKIKCLRKKRLNAELCSL